MLCQLGVSGSARWLTATLPYARAQQPLTAGAQAKHYARTWGLRRPVAEAAAAAYVNARNCGASNDAEAAARRAALVATERVRCLWRALALGLAQRHNAAAAAIQAAWRGARVRTDLARRRSAAAHIQAAWRGARARLALARRRSAASHIQAAWHGARARLSLARRRAAAQRLQAAWRGARARLALARRTRAPGPGAPPLGRRPHSGRVARRARSPGPGAPPPCRHRHPGGLARRARAPGSGAPPLGRRGGPGDVARRVRAPGPSAPPRRCAAPAGGLARRACAHPGAPPRCGGPHPGRLARRTGAVRLCQEPPQARARFHAQPCPYLFRRRKCTEAGVEAQVGLACAGSNRDACMGSALPDTLTAVLSNTALQHCLCVHAGCVVQPTACVCEHNTAACYWLHEPHTLKPFSHSRTHQ